MNLLNSLEKPSKAWRVSGLLILLGGVALTGGYAEAQSSRDLQSRINRLENEIDTLSRAVYKGEQPPPGAYSGGGASSADIEVRLQQMETELRDMRGEVERVSYENRQLREDMQRITGDLELRMNDLEGGGAQRPFNGQGGSNRVYNSPNTGSNRPVINTIDNTPPQPPVGGQQGQGQGYQWSSNSNNQLGSYTVDQQGNTTSGPSSPADLYDHAFSLVKSREYNAAQREFEDFLQKYPEHSLAGNAKYWLGETHYVRGDFETASRVFAEGYQQYPKGSKAADNLLKLGLSLEASGKPQDACIALRQLKKENPAGETPVLRRADQEMERLGC